MILYIITGLVFGGLLLFLLKRSNGKDYFNFSLKCKECGFHKGILKCVQCEDRKMDDWR